MYQKVILVGNLTKDPEGRVVATSDGRETHVVDFGIATNKKRGGSSFPTWWRVTVWGRQAETCQQYLSKGRLVLIEGEMQSDEGNPRIWEGSDGTPHASFEVTAQTVKFLGSRNNAEAPQVSPPQQETAPNDIPF